MADQQTTHDELTRQRDELQRRIADLQTQGRQEWGMIGVASAAKAAIADVA